MENSPKQDLVAAKAKHFLFKSKMRAYLDGSQEVAEEILADHSACMLGKWIIQTGKVKSAKYSEINELDQTHKRIHQTAKEIIRLKKSGEQGAAEAKLSEIDQISGEIVQIIDLLDAKLA